MTFSTARIGTILALCLATLLGGCGTVRMQSFDRFSKETTQATYHSDKKDCSRHTGTADYQQCIKRTDEAYEQLNKEREKDVKTR